MNFKTLQKAISNSALLNVQKPVLETLRAMKNACQYRICTLCAIAILVIASICKNVAIFLLRHCEKTFRFSW